MRAERKESHYQDESGPAAYCTQWSVNQGYFQWLDEMENNPRIYVAVMINVVPGVFCARGDLAEHVGAKNDVSRQREISGKIAVL